jgi:DNA ligase D-like protein (predicted 3'-phosphoesterase)
MSTQGLFGKGEPAGRNRFVVKEHHAATMHYDCRFEFDGVLISLVVKEGPSLNPNDKRRAVMVDDHKLKYLSSERIIPVGHYGAGVVLVWDTGTYELIDPENFHDCLLKGRVDFRLFGDQLCGQFSLCQNYGNEWYLTKTRDEYADPSWRIKTRLKGKPSQRSLPLHELLMSNDPLLQSLTRSRNNRPNGNCEDQLMFHF